MNIYIPEYPHVKDGIFSYIFDLVNVLRDRGHYVDVGVMSLEHYDVVFCKQMKPEGIPGNYILHIHNAVIHNSWKDTLVGFINRTGAIVTCNSVYQYNVLESVVGKSKVFILPNCIDERMFFDRKKHRKPKSILYIGRIEKNNSNTLNTLMSLMPRIPDYKLTLVGSLDETMRPLISIKNVEYYGEVDREDLFLLMNTHSMGVGVGRSAMEMLLCGMPVMIFGLGYAGWVTEENYQNLHIMSNMTTRHYEELSIDNKVNMILNDIHDPVIISGDDVVDEFGLRSNIHIYESLFEELINENI